MHYLCFDDPQAVFSRIQSFEVQEILLRVVSVSVYLSAPINLRRFDVIKTVNFVELFRLS